MKGVMTSLGLTGFNPKMQSSRVKARRDYSVSIPYHSPLTRLRNLEWQGNPQRSCSSLLHVIEVRERKKLAHVAQQVWQNWT